MAGAVPLPHAAVLDRHHFLAAGRAQVPAGETAERPADRLVRASQVEKVLLRFVGDMPCPAVRSGRAGFQPEEPLQRVDPRAGPTPLLVAVPVELGAHGFGHPPAVDVAEAAQNAPGHADAEGVDQFLPEQPLRDGVENQCPLSGEADQAPLGVELEEFPEVQLFNTHGATLPL